MTILFHFLLQIIAFPGLILLTGFMIKGGKHILYKISGKLFIKLEYSTAVIGTPVHEISHAIMCLLFWHKINKIKLFQIDPASHSLGYVIHSYHKRNLFQIIGNFFIGTAPVYCGTAIIMLLVYLLQPKTFFSTAGAFTISNISFAELGINILNASKSIILSFNIFDLKWWIVSIIASCIVIHMELSKEDIKGGTQGFLIYMGILAIINSILFFVHAEAVQNNLSRLLIAGAIGIFSVSFLYLVILVLVSCIIKCIYLLIKKIKR